MTDAILQDNVYLIPGADQGIGLHLARAICERGATSVLSGNEEGLLKDAAKRLMKDRLQSLFAPMDVTDEDQVRDVIGGVYERFGKLDGLVFNAGAGRVGPLADLSLDDWYWQLQTLMTGGFLALREALRVMAPNGAGRIVVVNSIAYRRPIRNQFAAAYRACRAGLAVLVEETRREAEEVGVEIVHALLPTDEMLAWDESDQLLDPPSNRIDAAALAGEIARFLDPALPYVPDEVVIRPPRAGA